MPALFVTLEREIPDFNSYVNGHALSAADRKLERLAKELGVTPLMEFFSQDPEEAAAFIEDEGGDPSEIDLPDETWFDGADGLKTVNALLEHLVQNPQAVPNADAVVDELREWQAVLMRAADHGVRWHLEVEI
jgi:hypothetical protein